MEIFFYFIVYAFGGWMLENVYNWGKTRIFFKENFLRAPLKPMYGIAPILLIYSTKVISNWTLILFLCLLIPSLVEYITGTLLEKYTQRKWWDYSDEKLHVHGHVCLLFSLYWVFLSLGVLNFLQPILTKLYQNHISMWNWIVIAFTVPFCIDVFLSVVKFKKQEIAFVDHEQVKL